MGLKFNLDPTVPRALMIAILLFFEAIAIPAYSITLQGRFPVPVEWTTYLLAAFIQLVTYLVTFLGKSEEEGSKT
jgi:heme/copper-type cytochrome/quinol oxidase subunit 4